MRYPIAFLLLCPLVSFSQLRRVNVDSAYGPLPSSIHVYFTDTKLDTAAFRAYYVIADLRDKDLHFTTDTTHKRRMTPSQFYGKDKAPIIVVNGTFFSFETNANLNVVIKDGNLVSHNSKTTRSLSDTTKRLPLYSSAIGISKKRRADVAWIKTDSTEKTAWASQAVIDPQKVQGNYFAVRRTASDVRQDKPSGTTTTTAASFQKWNVQTAIGGGPVLVQAGEIKITNEEEKMFAGKAIRDKHPRTAMGYTGDGKLVILVIEGRNLLAGGATLMQEARIFKDLGCVEALNLDGGGSSCLLINGKETITPSDKQQRAVPAVFLIHKK